MSFSLLDEATERLLEGVARLDDADVRQDGSARADEFAAR
jgi:hypothetical protein